MLAVLDGPATWGSAGSDVTLDDLEHDQPAIRNVYEDEICYLARFSWLSSCLSLCTSASTVSTGGFSREGARGLGVVAAVRVVDVSPGFDSGTLSEELLEGKQY